MKRQLKKHGGGGGREERSVAYPLPASTQLFSSIEKIIKESSIKDVSQTHLTHCLQPSSRPGSNFFSQVSTSMIGQIIQKDVSKMTIRQIYREDV